MSINEFLEKLAGLKKPWRSVGGYIRCGYIEHGFTDDFHCPISAVTGNPDDLGDPHGAAIALGMSLEDGISIQLAADSHRKSNPVLRSRILKACGLEEMT